MYFGMSREGNRKVKTSIGMWPYIETGRQKIYQHSKYKTKS